jgi:CRISPR-associated protein Csd2
MSVRLIFDFEHIGTQSAANAGQNGREARLGCAHAHKLFEGVTFKRKLVGDRTFPTSFDDYELIDKWRDQQAADGRLTARGYEGVKLNRILDPLT